MMTATAIATAMSAFACASNADRAQAHGQMSAQDVAEIVRSYDIPAGLVSTALNSVADQSGVRIVYDSRLTGAQRTKGLSGRRNLSEALAEVLSSTGLSYELSPNGKSVLVVLAQAETARNDGAEALPPIDVGAEARPTSRAANGGARYPSEPKTPEEGYVVKNATTATKTDVPIRQTPVTVQVVPKQVMQDQNIRTLQEALENIPGVRSNNNQFEGYNFTIRGFGNTVVYRNGLTDGASDVFDTANLERIEVLKGPASILYGRMEPGGMINLVTKQPLAEPRYVLEQQIGSFAHYRTQWDLSTPVEQVPGLAWRLSGAYQTNGSFRAFQNGERILVAPVVSYRPSDWTEFTLDTQFASEYVQSDLGFTATGPYLPSIPASRSFQERNDPPDRQVSYKIGYTFKQNLDENWKVTNRFLYTDAPIYDKNDLNFVCFIDCVEPDLRTLTRAAAYQFSAARSFSTNIDVSGKFEALGGAHDFLFGLDYLNKSYEYYTALGTNFYSIDTYAPVYGTVPDSAYWEAVVGTGFKYAESSLTRQKGMYVQDHVTWFERLHVLLGARYDIADSTFGSFFLGGTDPGNVNDLAMKERLAAKSQADKAWTPRAGAVYDILPELSVYASYSQSFGANNGGSPSGAPFPPQKGLQWETGMKAEPLPGLTANLAFFQLTKSNVLTRDFTSPIPSAQKLTGLQRSRGVEFDVIGRVAERITVAANYAYTDAKVISDNPRDPANLFGSGHYLDHLANTPRHSGKVFVTYDFGEGGLGLRVGSGVTAATHAWATLENSLLLPSWARLDAFVSYATLIEGHKVTAQLNLNNLTNTRYFGSLAAFGPTGIIPANPFTATGGLRFEW